MMEYTADNPSPRWRELVALYRRMHTEGDGQPSGAQLFAGMPREKHIVRMGELIRGHGASNLLDYGSGKGLQWEMELKIHRDGETRGPMRLQTYLGLDRVQCYDPGHAPFSNLPEDTYDGVICLDVLEHCPEPDISWILDQIMGYSKHFVLANIASFPAKKTLPNGENAHCTIQPATWWRAKIEEVAKVHPNIDYRIYCEESAPDGDEIQEVLISR